METKGLGSKVIGGLAFCVGSFQFARLIIQVWDVGLTGPVGRAIEVYESTIGLAVREMAEHVLWVLLKLVPWLSLPPLENFWTRLVGILWLYIGLDVVIDWRRGSGRKSQMLWAVRRRGLNSTYAHFPQRFVHRFRSRWRSVSTAIVGLPLAVVFGALAGLQGNSALHIVAAVVSAFTVYESYRALLSTISEKASWQKYRHFFARFVLWDFLLGLFFIGHAAFIPTNQAHDSGLILAIGYLVSLALRNIIQSWLWVVWKLPAGNFRARYGLYRTLWTPVLGFSVLSTMAVAAFLAMLGTVPWQAG